MELFTEYLGLRLKSPVVVSASPLSKDVDKVKQAEAAGAGAVVMHSLFEEQILIEERTLNENLLQGTDSYAEALSYFPNADAYDHGPAEYLDQIRSLKESIQIPVIASLNGVSKGGWIDYAKKIEMAGADALELNIYFIPADVKIKGHQVEEMYLTLVKDIAASVEIPVAVKLSPYFSATPNLLKSINQAGAKGLVLFNRFYQPDFDLSTMTVHPRITLSTPQDLTLRLRWAAILFRQVEADLAITGGVHSAGDVIKSILAGANVAMMTSALLRNGPAHIKSVLEGIQNWMEKKGYTALDQVLGLLSHQHVAEPAAFERANYMKILGSYH